LPSQTHLIKGSPKRPLKEAKKIKKSVDVPNTTDKTVAISRRKQIMKSQKYSFLLAAVGALALTAVFVPKANALNQLQVYFNFNTEANKAMPPYSSVPVGTYITGEPLQQTTLFSDPTTGFPGGQLVIDSAAGNTTNQFSLDPSVTGGGALDVMGQAAGSASTEYCFDIGSFSTVGLTDVSLNFAIAAVSNNTGGAFTTLVLSYGTNGTTWTMLDTIAISQNTGFSTIPNESLPSGQSTLFLQFCFSGATNASGHVYIDNIQVNSVIPEPSTYIGGLLGVVVLCWYQRQWLMRTLRFGRA
jgi:hypothetical protein